MAVAVAVHLVLAAVLLHTITFDTSFRDYLGLGRERPVEERITFVQTAPETPPPVPAREPAVRAPVSAPSRGPVLGDAGAVPTAPVERLAPPVVDSGAAVNRLPPAEAAVVGLVPRADERLWTVGDLRSLRDEVRAEADGANGRLPGAREIDSVITWALGSARDSLDSLAVVHSLGPRTASWTKTDSKGGTWGVDASGIRLGKVTIPSALLGLLPMGAQQALTSNPIEAERNRRLSYAQSDIARFRTAGPGNDQFKMLVEELRERRDRERAERRRYIAKPAVVAPDQSGSNNTGRP